MFGMCRIRKFSRQSSAPDNCVLWASFPIKMNIVESPHINLDGILCDLRGGRQTVSSRLHEEGDIVFARVFDCCHDVFN